MNADPSSSAALIDRLRGAVYELASAEYHCGRESIGGIDASVFALRVDAARVKVEGLFTELRQAILDAS